MLKTSRVRTKDDTQSCEPVSVTYKPTGSVSHPYANVSVGGISTISDDNNGPFRHLQRIGVKVFSDCSLSRMYVSRTPAQLESKYRTLEGCIEIPTFSGLPVVDFPTNVESQEFLLIKATAKMNESEMLVGEIASSMSQTVSMLRKPFASAQTLLTKVRKVRNWKLRRKSATYARTTADTWLEYRYGWQPIISDSVTAIRALQGKLAKDGRVLVARAGSSASNSESSSWPARILADGSGSQGSHSSTKTLKRDVGIMYRVRFVSADEEKARITGSRLCDIPSTLYEAMPYSFVVDWFFNVGDWIRAVTPTPGIYPINNWCTNIRDSVYTVSAECKYPPGYYYYPLDQYLGSWGSYTLRTFEYSRDTRIDLPSTPSLRYNGLSWKHQADALSLMVPSIIKGLQSWRH